MSHFADISAAASHSAVLDASATSTSAHVASHAVNVLAKLTLRGIVLPPSEEARTARLIDQLRGGACKHLNGREVSKAAWGLGKLWPCCSAMSTARDAIAKALTALAESCCAGGGGLDAQAVVGVLHALGVVGHALHATSPETVRGLQRRMASFASAQACSPQDVANGLWALARLGSVAEASLVSALDEARDALLPHFKPLEVSSTAWALAKLQVRARLAASIHARQPSLPVPVARVQLAMHSLPATARAPTLALTTLFRPSLAQLYPAAELGRLVASLHAALLAPAPGGKGGKGGKDGKDGGIQSGRGGGGACDELLRGLSAQGVANCLYAFVSRHRLSDALRCPPMPSDAF